MKEVSMETNDFATCLREMRLKRGLSQFGLSLKLGMTPSKIAHYEQGLRNPTQSSIDGIAKAMKLTRQEYMQLIIAAGLLPDFLEVICDDPLIIVEKSDTVRLTETEKEEVAKRIKDRLK